MKINLLLSILLTVFFQFGIFSSSSASQDSIFITEEIHRWVESKHEQNIKKHGNHSDFLLKKGLVANRKSQEIEILAVATGLGAEVPIEFIIVGQNGKDYESIAVTPVLPSEIYRALIFIGMEPGHPVDVSKMVLWPRGERVFITFHWEEKNPKTGKRSPQLTRAENLVYNSNWKEPIPQLGLRFTGSKWIPSPGDSQKLSCKADDFGDIASVFTSPWALFDIPYEANQSEVYGSLFPNPQFLLKKGQKLRIKIRPEFTDGTKRGLDLTLHVQKPKDLKVKSFHNLHFSLLSRNQESPLSKGNFEGILEVLNSLVSTGKEPFLKLQFEDNVLTSTIIEFCNFVQKIQEQGGNLYIEPDRKHLFFQAFLPQGKWRSPSNRGPAPQPLEIHVVNDEGTERISGSLIHDPNPLPSVRNDFSREQLEFSSLNDLVSIIKARRPWRTNKVFFFVDENTPYGILKTLYAKLKIDLPIAFVFLKPQK